MGQAEKHPHLIAAFYAVKSLCTPSFYKQQIILANKTDF
jgi:hypothetical protein